jgi:hypothetical protein
MKTIELTRGKFTIVDDEDYDRLIKHSWAWIPPTGSRSGRGYAVRKGNKRRGEPRTIQMHREILNPSANVAVDHVNLNSLDNRKANLRVATVQQNGFNRHKPIMKCTSRYKGVLQRQNDTRWVARIKFNGRHVELGKYEKEEIAASAYNLASRIFFGRYRHENEGVEELDYKGKLRIFNTAKRYIDRYGWYVDTETYRSFVLHGVS